MLNCEVEDFVIEKDQEVLAKLGSEKRKPIRDGYVLFREVFDFSFTKFR